jgi:hypothetical protein
MEVPDDYNDHGAMSRCAELAEESEAARLAETLPACP